MLDLSEARAEADLIIKAVTGMASHELILRADDYLSGEQEIRLAEILKRRAAREPVQYILGEASFMGLSFAVGPGVLIPRGDTETLVEAAVRYIEEYLSGAPAHLVEVGAGSGAIVVSLLSRFQSLTATAFEISPAAAAYCTRNAERHNVAARLDLRLEDFACGMSGIDRQCHIFISNPPYIPVADMAGLAPEVQDYEPHTALCDEGDGLRFYRDFAGMLSASGTFSGAAVFLECGDTQAISVLKLFEDEGYRGEVIFDLNGKARVVAALPAKKTL